MPQEELIALNVMVPKSYKDGLDRIANAEFTSSAAVVRRALRFFLERVSTNVDTAKSPAAGKACKAKRGSK